MNPDIKTAWLAALRSGEYEQGYGLLHPTEDTFCCLGVLCDLHSKTIDGDSWVEGRYLDIHDTLPRVVIYWAGLEDQNPYIPIPGGYATLAEHNDGRLDYDLHPHTFAEIADLIEKHL